MSEATEREILQHLQLDLQSEGYEVYVQPNKALVPRFLKDYRPDAIAIRGDKKLVIEITGRSAASLQKVKNIQNLMEGQAEWQFKVIWDNPALHQKSLSIQSVEVIRTRLNEMRRIAVEGHIEAAVLLGWASLEALARANILTHLERPQPPARLVQALASEGYLTPAEADQMRILADMRNRLSHGELNMKISKETFEILASVLEDLFEQIISQSR